MVIKNHIALLHKYNEIKDIGQGLMGLIADKRDCRVVSVMEEFGVGEYFQRRLVVDRRTHLEGEEGGEVKRSAGY